MGGVGPAHHAEPVEQAEQAGEDRDEQRDLQGERPASVLMRMISAWISGGWSASCSSSAVLLITSASSSSACGDLLLGGGRQHGAVLAPSA